MSIYIGIDPGWTGAISVCVNRKIQVFNCPKNHNEMYNLLQTLTDGVKSKYAVIEEVHGRGMKEGIGVRWSAQNTFRFGENYGAWLSSLHACGVIVEHIEPKKWQRFILGKFAVGRSKETSLLRSKKQHPELVKVIGENHNKADAVNLMDLCIMWKVR